MGVRVYTLTAIIQHQLSAICVCVGLEVLSGLLPYLGAAAESSQGSSWLAHVGGDTNGYQ